jgi:hypothetical protein
MNHFMKSLEFWQKKNSFSRGEINVVNFDHLRQQLAALVMNAARSKVNRNLGHSQDFFFSADEAALQLSAGDHSH